MRRGWPAWVVLVLLGAAACVFQPDFSRFPTCGAEGTCPAGWTCLAQEGICLPDCGERGPCPESSGTDGGDAGLAPLVLAPEGPGEGLETVSYFHRFQASGGTPPYSFSTPSEPPPGLSLSPQGELSGKPASAGDFLFTLEVVDQGAPPQRSSRELAVRIQPLLRLAGPAILANVPSGSPYVERLSATGGSPPYTFELVTGNTLPANIVLHDSGRVEGKADEASATRAFDVRVTDSSLPPRAVTRTLQITTGSCATLMLCVRTRTVPDGRVGTAYSYTLQSSGGSGSVTWKLEPGSTLPPGLALSETGVLSGTPTEARAQPYELTLLVSDVFDSFRVPLTLKVF